MIARLVHAVRYLRTGQLPPDPNEHAHNTYWITLDKTAGDMNAASAARNLILTGSVR